VNTAYIAVVVVCTDPERPFLICIARLHFEALRRPVESAQYLAMAYTQRLAEASLVPSDGSVI